MYNVSMTVIRLMYQNQLDSTWRMCYKRKELLSRRKYLWSPTGFFLMVLVLLIYLVFCVVLCCQLCLFIIVPNVVYPMLPVFLHELSIRVSNERVIVFITLFTTEQLYGVRMQAELTSRVSVGFVLLNLQFVVFADHSLSFFFRTLYCLSVDRRLPITIMVSSNLCPLI